MKAGIVTSSHVTFSVIWVRAFDDLGQGSPGKHHQALAVDSKRVRDEPGALDHASIHSEQKEMIPFNQKFKKK